MSAEFLIGLHKKDIGLLREIQVSLGGIGRTGKFAQDAYALRVNTISQMAMLIDHFDKYPLVTQKRADYLLWREVINMMQRKEHITQEGLLTILSLKASMNLGLSENLKVAFPDIVPALRSRIDNISISHGEWFAGFASGEGCFYISVTKSLTNVCGFKVQSVFQITQHIRDVRLIRSLISYLDCGKLVTSSDNKVQFRVENFSDNFEKVSKFFDNYKIRGVKFKDFKDWCLVLKLMQDQKHLTLEGINKIIKIKTGMNKGRS